MPVSRLNQPAFVIMLIIGSCVSLHVLLAQDNAETKTEQQTSEALFASLDKNSDGKVTAAEIPADRLRFFERLLRVAGKEKNGELTKTEFIEAASKRDDLKVDAPPSLGIGGGGNRPDPNQLFQRYDRNKDGKLTRDEIPEQAPPQFKQMFDRLRKQEFTREEFVEALRMGARGGAGGAAFMRDPEGFFKRLDSNQDGKVTLAEAPEEFRPQVERWLTNRLGKSKEDSLTLDDLKKIVAENRAREGRPPGMPAGTMPPGAGRGGFSAVLMRKLDANGDGKLSKEELQKIGDIFDELDSNHDGFLEPAELSGPPAGARINAGAATVTPRDGNDSPATADSGVSKTAGAGGARPAGAAVDVASRKTGRAGGPPAQGPLKRFDTNGDGKISRDEAQGKLKENFAKIDTNGDGFLEPDEIRKALAAISSK